MAASGDKQNYDSRLERLPPEVRRHLLSTLDLPRLKILVHASPTFHAQYLLDRKYVLCSSLENTLSSAAVDAYAVSQSAVQAGETPQNVAVFFKSYSRQMSRRRLPLAETLTQDESLSMSVFYLNYVAPIIEYYARWTMDNLVKAGGRSRSHRPEASVTSTETTRIVRAIYRFQLLSQLVGPNSNVIGQSRGQTVLALLDLLEPWEIEELFSFYQFAVDVYDKIFNDIHRDLHPDYPRFTDQCRPPTPDGAFDMDIPLNRCKYLEGTTLRGLSLLNAVLFGVEDHEQLVLTMQQNIISSYIPFNAFEGVLGDVQQAVRRGDRPSERDRIQAQRAPSPFLGDGAPVAPPLAWTTIWNDTYSNLYGWYISDEMRRWGYVFWDAATLEETWGEEVLQRQWAEYWDEDPRDRLI